jgi:hypothetical protein
MDHRASQCPAASRACRWNPLGHTTTTIINDTPYTLRVRLAWTTYLLAPGQAQTITVSPGRYNETVEVLDASVQPYIGTQMYEQGYDYQERFFIKSGQPEAPQAAATQGLTPDHRQIQTGVR